MSFQQRKATSPRCVNALIKEENTIKKEKKIFQVTPMEFLGLGIEMQLINTVHIENKRLVLCGHQM